MYLILTISAIIIIYLIYYENILRTVRRKKSFSFHPILNQKVQTYIIQLIWYKRRDENKISTESGPKTTVVGARTNRTVNNNAPTSILGVLGGPLLNHSEPSSHFRLLKNYWEKVAV